MTHFDDQPETSADTSTSAAAQTPHAASRAMGAPDRSSSRAALRRREQQLAESERFVEQITRAIPDLIYVYDRRGDGYFFLNLDAVADALGYSAEQRATWGIAGLDALMHPDDRALLPAWTREVDQAADTTLVELEFRLQAGDGDWRWFHSRDRVFARDERGWPIQTLGVAQDITERKLAEQKLRQQNAYFVALSEILPGLMNRLDPVDLLQTLLSHARQLVAADDGFIDLIEPDSEHADEFVSVGQFTTYNYRNRRGEGLVGRVWESGQPLVVDDYATWEGRVTDADMSHIRAAVGVPLTSAGQVVGVLGLTYRTPGAQFSPDEVELLRRLGELASVALDNARLYSAAQHELATRRRTEEALKKERDFVSAIVSNSLVLLVVVDRDGRIVTFNRACQQMTGYSFDEVRGLHYTSLFLLAEDVSDVTPTFEAVIAGNFPNSSTNAWRMRDGSVHVIEWSNSALTDDDGRVTHVVSTGIDITFRRELEARSVELLLEREKVRMLGNFVRDASHDFRTPLSILNTNLYLLRRAQTPERQTERIDEMERQVTAINRMLDQLLTMTRLDMAVEPAWHTVNLNHLVHNARTRLHGNASQRGVEISLALDPALPSIRADEGQLAEAVSNLVSNAVLFTPAGGQVVLRTCVEGEMAVIEVRDTGSGIPAEQLEHIFERFFRGDASRPRIGSGAGLGLPIARRIVELHRGRIDVESAVGEGSTFRVLLPLQRPG